MSAVNIVNPGADLVRGCDATMMNINAARGLYDVLKSNLGPKGTLKMLVGGAGDLKLTKDGNTLLHEMMIQHPTAALIARIATAQDDVAGDGTTSNVLIIGDLMKQSERYLADGLHPRLICEGIQAAKSRVLEFLDKVKTDVPVGEREFLIKVAASSLRTKLHAELADLVTEIVVDAVRCVKKEGEQLDLHMVEIMSMQHRHAAESRLVRGLVMDHGGRHPDMKKTQNNCFILTCNATLEYEKSEVNSGFMYSNADQREKMLAAERKWVDDRVQLVLALKAKVCTEGQELVMVNQKGIDPLALDMLQKHGILALRRAKRRNMERLTLACGGTAINSFDDMSIDDLGWAETVYEQQLGEDAFTFIEGTRHPLSCTILLKGPHKHTIDQMKDAVRDGLRAVRNAVEDGQMVPGAGAFELLAHQDLMEFKKSVIGRAKLGVQAYADALLVIPRTLAENAGYDANDTLIKLQEAVTEGKVVGVDINSGDPIDPESIGVWDNWRVKRQMLDSSAVICEQLLLVDEIIRAGKQIKKAGPGDGVEYQG
mmetsp:Transcript_18693/g.47763  ORF Transcript_18693/g.47763 Transcript_18693/m.47763 type:complete len:541 (+) Transcript_18693:45-1667(+)